MRLNESYIIVKYRLVDTTDFRLSLRSDSRSDCSAVADQAIIAAIVVVIANVVANVAERMLQVVGCFATAQGFGVGASAIDACGIFFIGDAAASNLFVDL